MIWAAVQYNLGQVLRRMGEATGSPGWLQQSANAYRMALLEYSHRKHPKEWAETKTALGLSLLANGLLVTNTDLLDQAKVAFTDVLEIGAAPAQSNLAAQLELNLARADLGLFTVKPDKTLLLTARSRALAARHIFMNRAAPHYVYSADKVLLAIAAYGNP